MMIALSLPAAADESVAQLLAQGDPDTLTAWGQRYEHGEGVDRDVGTAIRLYCRAARAGHSGAQYQLGWLYANGRGVPRNDALASAWFRLAAAQGDAHAARMLNHVDDPSGRAVKPACPGAGGGSGHANPNRREVAVWVDQLAPAYGLAPELVLAVIEVESNFNPRALSPKNAQGLMQLIPATAERFGVRDVWDPVENIRGGMAYLRWLLDHFEGDLALALAGYNAGENAVTRHGGIPPYAETRAYVRKISAMVRPTMLAGS